MTSSMPGDMNRDPQGGALIRLRGVYPSLKTALQKVANLIMRQPEMAIYASVNEVAAAAHVSEATVMRFCRTLGFKGFQDFKISLARELVAPSSQRMPEEAGAEDDPPALVRRTFQANIAALKETLEVLDLRLLQEAAQYLLTCRRLAIIGVTGAGPVVHYADLRFNSLGLMVHGFTEKYQILTVAALLTAEDALLAISHFGNTQEILDAAQVAKENGARVIAVTSNSIAPLTRIADLVLITAGREMTPPRDGLGSFLCQISVIDSLFALLQQARPQEFRDNLAKIEKALQGSA
ncbi:MAG: MurR/RpiR family transcriptional regulator [Desulfobaccales bacterium]